MAIRAGWQNDSMAVTLKNTIDKVPKFCLKWKKSLTKCMCWQSDALPGGAPGAPPTYLSCLWSNFQNFFVWWKLVKIPIDFYHKWLPIIHSLAARGRRSDKGQSCLISSEKIQKFQFFSHKHVIYLKRTHFSCRIQLHDEKIWFDGKKLKKFRFFNFFCQKRGWPGIFDG